MKNAQSKVIGIFGNPVQHSKSPTMHNYVFRKNKLPFNYVTFETEPELLKTALDGFKAMNFHGANVTLPYKSKIMPYLDEVSELASLTESVNTIYWEDGKLKGTTTDGYGALKNLEHHNVDFQNKKIALLGNGGSARAIAFQLATDAPDSKLTIVSRKRERGSMLSDQVNNFKDGYSNCITFDAYGEISKEFDLIINTTPIGLEPNIDESPLGSDQIHPHQTVYDIVYIPLKTKLLKDAENKGAKIVTGIGMLIFQGLKSFEYWTKIDAPVADFFESIEKIDS